MQEILGTMRRAITDYGMIADGDKVAVGVSGGKDSMALLEGLHLLRRFIGISYELVAITIDPCFGGEDGDYSLVSDFCAKRDIPYIIKRTDLATIIFDIRKEKNPCSLCAKMRRGAIHDTAKEHGCNKLALGHHQNDVIETVLMNLFIEGRMGCFRPVTYLSRKDLTMIRPLIYLPEKKIIKARCRADLPVVKSVCPMDGVSERQKTKELIQTLEKSGYPMLSIHLFGAMQRSSLDGWKPAK